MRIGIYNHQHLRGGCPICTQTYVQGMIADGMKCMNRAKGIYGEDNEFVNYTDLGDYPSENLERPGFRRLMKDIEEDNLDVIVVITLDKITTDIDLGKMARKFKLNEDKFKVAFIFANEGCNPKKDRSIIESEKIIMYVVGCADYSQAETVAQEMLEEGCAAIDLCGAFGNEGVARISKAVDRQIPVGAVHFDFHPAFRDKSGDDLFQKDFWCIGL